MRFLAHGSASCDRSISHGLAAMERCGPPTNGGWRRAVVPGASVATVTV